MAQTPSVVNGSSLWFYFDSACLRTAFSFPENRISFLLSHSWCSSLKQSDFGAALPKLFISVAAGSLWVGTYSMSLLQNLVWPMTKKNYTASCLCLPVSHPLCFVHWTTQLCSLQDVMLLIFQQLCKQTGVVCGMWRDGSTAQEMTCLDHFCSGLSAIILVYVDKHLGNFFFSYYKVECICLPCIMNPGIKCCGPSCNFC